MIKEINLKIDWLFWFIFLLPTFYIFGANERLSQEQFFLFSGMVLVCLFHVNKWIGAFIGWAIFHYLFFDVPKDSMAISNLFMFGIVYHFLVKLMEYDKFKKYFWAFYGLLFLNLFWCALQANQIDPLFSMRESWNQTKMTEYSGFFMLPAFLGNFASSVLPLAFCLTPYLIPLALIALVISKSTFSVMAGLVSLLFVLWFKKRILFWIFLLVGLSASIFYIVKFDLPTGQFQRRLPVWRAVVHESFKTQFFGHGVGSYSGIIVGESTPSHSIVVTKNEAYVKKFIMDRAADSGKWGLVETIKNYNSSFYDVEAMRVFKRNLQKEGMDFEVWNYPHNEFIQAFYEFGLIGVFLIGAFIFDFFRRFFEYGKKDPFSICLIASFISILIVSFGHFPFHLARLSGPFLVLLAMLDLSLIVNKKIKEEAW